MLYLLTRDYFLASVAELYVQQLSPSLNVTYISGTFVEIGEK